MPSFYAFRHPSCFGSGFPLPKQEAGAMFKMITPRLSIGAACVAAAVLCGPRVAQADVVLDWNVTMLTTLTGVNPFAGARFAAITQLAVFEAVNAITGEYRPYLGTISALAGASAEAAAAAAAHAVLKAYFPAKSAALDAAFAASLGAIANGQAKDDGVATGEASAAAMIALRANDASAVAQFYLPTSSEPGEWQLTPSCSASGGILLNWRKVTPFGVPAVHQFIPGPPPPLTSDAYHKDYDEVKTVGGVNSGARPADRADVARFYATFSPVAWANVALQQVAMSLGQSVSENARALALVNMAVNDAAIASFATKYHYTLWRPETAIRAGETDTNKKTDADPNFVPYIVAPCFPGYPSNHASLSGAAREVLESLYGPDAHDITFTNPAVPGVTLHYTNFEGITHDIDDARVYGGIHFRFDQETGGLLGRRVGAYVFTHNLRVVHP
jgi:hypothetical protein